MTPLRQARERRGWTQTQVVHRLRAVANAESVTVAGAEALEAQLRRWENGRSGVSPRYQRLLCQVYGCPPSELGFLGAAPPPARPPWPMSVAPLAPAVEDDVTAMKAFRAADQRIGGAHLYASVRRYLHHEVAPRLVGGASGHDGRALFTGAAGLTEMAGWMAHDAGDDAAARQHFDRALDLAGVGGDTQLGAHVLGSLAHLAHELGQPDDAIRLARQGQDVLADGTPHPGLAARLLAMQARGYAATGRASACVEALGQAEQALDRPFAYEPSPWVSHFDIGSLASEAARCMHRLGEVSEAKRQAHLILELRPVGRTRSRAFGQLALVTALIAEGHPDEACAVAGEVVDATQSLGSFVVISQLQELLTALSPWRSNPTVKDFLECLEQTLRERLWLNRWVTAGDRPPAVT